MLKLEAALILMPLTQQTLACQSRCSEMKMDRACELKMASHLTVSSSAVNNTIMILWQQLITTCKGACNNHYAQ